MLLCGKMKTIILNINTVRDRATFQVWVLFVYFVKCTITHLNLQAFYQLIASM